MRAVCGYQHILGIIRMEDDPNSPDLQKDSLRREDSYMSPFVCHRCKPASSVNVSRGPYFICDLLGLNITQTSSVLPNLSNVFFLRPAQGDDVFCWWLEFSIQLQRFSNAHTAKDKHPQLCIIPLIAIPESHLYLRERAKELQTIFISLQLHLQQQVNSERLLICTIPTTVRQQQSLILWVQMAEWRQQLEEAGSLLIKQFKIVFQAFPQGISCVCAAH